MAELGWADALDRLIRLFQFRKTARKELLETEFSSFTGEVLEAQMFFIEGIEDLRKRFTYHAKRAEELLSRNDSADAIRAMCTDLDALFETIEDKRHIKKADRMAIARIADARTKKEYFEKSVLTVITDDERDAFREFYEAVRESFGYPERVYYHDLAAGLRIAQNGLDRISLYPVHLTEEQKHQLLRALIDTKRHLENLRSVAQERYASTKVLHDRIFSSLLSL